MQGRILLLLILIPIPILVLILILILMLILVLILIPIPIIFLILILIPIPKGRGAWKMITLTWETSLYSSHTSQTYKIPKGSPTCAWHVQNKYEHVGRKVG